MKDITIQIAENLRGKERCNVLVVYEDAATRDRATSACDFLVQRFWTDIEFEFFWWRMEYLIAPELGERAALNAADADILFFALNKPPLQASWFDRWLTHRQGHAGLLVQLTEISSCQSTDEMAVARFFQEVAGRAMLDFLSASPHRSDNLMPDDEDNAGSRGNELTPGLNNVMRRSTPPSHSGINE